MPILVKSSRLILLLLRLDVERLQVKVQLQTVICFELEPVRYLDRHLGQSLM